MKKLVLAIGLVFGASSLAGCQFIDKFMSDAEMTFKGKTMTIQSYDDDANIVDKVEGTSISIAPDSKFAKTNSNGETTKDSSVINYTVGGKQMLAVGSSTIVAEKGLTNLLDDYLKEINVENSDRSVPFVNRMVNSWKNTTTGKAMTVVIRNQTGKPIGVFTGDRVSYYASDVDKATEFLIDGKMLFVYRCNMSVYETALLK